MNGGMIRGRDITPDDVLDRIFKAWINHRVDEDLNLEDRFVLERMEYIDALLREGGERSRYKNIIEDAFENFKGTDAVARVTRRTIETDVARTKRFFLAVRPRDDKEYAKGKYIEWGEKLLAKFEEKENWKEWNKLFKELNELQGFKQEDIDRPDYSLLQPPPLMVMTNPEDIGVPAIDNLEQELLFLKIPKKELRNTDNIDEAEPVDGDE